MTPGPSEGPERRNVVGQDQAQSDSDATDEEQRQHPVDGEDGAGETLKMEEKKDGQKDDNGRKSRID